MLDLESPKNAKSLPKHLTLNESLKLLDSVTDGQNKERDYCILTLFLNCGLRLSELVAINITDVRDDNSLKIIGKGRKERMVYLNDACVSAIAQYKKARPSVNLIDKNALFISRFRKRISPKTVQHIVYTYLEKSGLSGMGYSAHKLRHTAATLLYQHGKVDVLVLKELLGHENLSTTEIYTHVANEQVRAAVNANPLSKKKS
jgi:site-specific recombinase XerD